ncbi:hypothetical protein BGW80DRAFT_390490, partial [Lactifluus volemus]
MQWVHNGSDSKSAAQIDDLVNKVILAEGFNPQDLRGDAANGRFSLQRENQRLDSYEGEPSIQDGWKKGKIVLRLPGDKYKNLSEDVAPALEIDGIWYRSLTEVLKSAFAETDTKDLHLQPFKLYWRNPDDPNATPVRLFSELYNTDAFLDAHSNLTAQHREPGCELEKVIAAMMLWSDSTHLASFGTASLWPLYLYLGNGSKYQRAKPTSLAAHHVAYIPSLPDKTQDVYTSIFNQAASAATLTYLKREVMQSMWRLLLDEQFVHAYIHGIKIKCADGVIRRVYPRIFTYSADYPEKVLLATIKSMGQCPCPHCLVEKDQIAFMGTKLDMKRRRDKARQDSEARQQHVDRARKRIYEFGDRVNAKRFEDLFGPTSAVPNRNAFSQRLFQHGFDFYKMFVPDLMHEFELGVWKSIFTHLMRILYANGGTSIQILNERYRQVPTFGHDTIRVFNSNASAMKKLAARDFEDLLQCAIPVFEGILPSPHSALVSDLLFVLATWHAYAKLRLHTEHTLEMFEEATSTLGKVVRHFRKTSREAFNTYELPREEAARGRRKAAMAAVSDRSRRATDKKKRYLNLSTYKFHRLGDYVEAIRQFGTTDNFTTQVGELEHRRVKRFYARTNKNKNFTQQVAQHQRRERILKNMQAHMGSSTHHAMAATDEDDEIFAYALPTDHYHIS